MAQKDINSAIKAIQDDIFNFDYNAILLRLNTEKEMNLLYEKATNNYEKLQLYRIIMQGENQTDLHKNDVVRKFINEAFHIENEFVMQLDPSKYSLVPQYIIDECDQILLNQQKPELLSV